MIAFKIQWLCRLASSSDEFVVVLVIVVVVVGGVFYLSSIAERFRIISGASVCFYYFLEFYLWSVS